MMKDRSTSLNQNECPYRYPPFKHWAAGYWDEADWQITKYRDDNGLHFELIGTGYPPDCNTIANFPTEISFCPKCGRKLNDEESSK